MKALIFISEKDGELYERQIALGAGISAASANSILGKFTRLGLVKKSVKGRMSFYKRNDENPLLRQFKIFITVDNLLALLEKAIPLSRRIVLFGSCAIGRNGEKSDIDLFFLSSGKSSLRRIAETNKKVQAIVLDSVEYSALAKLDKPLYGRINAGIELYGGEGYG